MRRRAFNTLCLLSLLLAVAVAALSVRSLWWATDVVLIPTGVDAGAVVVASTRGGVALIASETSSRLGYRSLRPFEVLLFLDVWGPRSGRERYGAFIPGWLLVLGFATGAGVLLRPRAKYHTSSCPRCGYDLRATSGPACPECGDIIAAAK